MNILRLFSLTVQKSKTHFHQIALERRAQFIFGNLDESSYFASNFDRKDPEIQDWQFIKIDDGISIGLWHNGITIYDLSHTRSERLSIGWDGLKQRLHGLLRLLEFPQISMVVPCTMLDNVYSMGATFTIKFFEEAKDSMKLDDEYRTLLITRKKVYMSIIRWTLEKDFSYKFKARIWWDKARKQYVKELELSSEREWEAAKKRFKN